MNASAKSTWGIGFWEKKLLFANNFQFLLQLKSSFSWKFSSRYIASGCAAFYCVGSQVGCYKGKAGPQSRVSPPAYIEIDSEVTIPPPQSPLQLAQRIL